MGAGYTEQPHQRLPRGLVAKLLAIRAEQYGKNHRFTAALIACREADWGVPAIAAALGMEPKAVARRICRGRRHPAARAARERLLLDIPAPPVPADKHPRTARKGETQLPQHITEHLLQLRAVSCGYRPTLPADHPARAAGAHLVADILHLLALTDRQGERIYTARTIAETLGVTRGSITNWIAAHGDTVLLAAAA